MSIHEVPSNTNVSDWIIPKELEINEAFLCGPDGKKLLKLKLTTSMFRATPLQLL